MHCVAVSYSTGVLFSLHMIPADLVVKAQQLSAGELWHKVASGTQELANLNDKTYLSVQL